MTDVATEPKWRQFAPYETWTDTAGCIVRIDVLAERPGPEHCGWQDASVIITGRVLGERYTSIEDTKEYVRDPAGVFERPELTAGFDAAASVPKEAVDTGYRRGSTELWRVPGDDDAMYLIYGGAAERWPAGTTPVCS